MVMLAQPEAYQTSLATNRPCDLAVGHSIMAWSFIMLQAFDDLPHLINCVDPVLQKSSIPHLTYS